MDESEPTYQSSIDRRSVLKGIGASSAAAILGVPAFAGSAAAQSVRVFYSITPATNVNLGGNNSPELGSVEQELVKYNVADVSGGTITATGVSSVTQTNWVALGDSFVGTDVRDDTLQVPTIAFDESGNLYGVAINQLRNTDSGNEGFGWFFEMDTGTGEVTLLNSSPSDILRGIWGITFDDNGDLYGLNTNNDNLYSIDVNNGSTTQVGSVSETDHTGLGFHQNSGNIWIDLGDTTGDENGDDIAEFDPEASPINSSLLAADVFDPALLRGFEVGPCSDVAFAVRAGNQVVSTAPLGIGATATDIGDVVYDIDGDGTDEDLLVDNMAVNRTVECCVECPSDLYWKFEWDDEEEDVNSECDGDFVIYDEDDNVVDPSEVENIELVSVSCDEDGEPQEACFETTYCEVSSTVKAGPETKCVRESGDFDRPVGEFCVEGIYDENKGVTKAISNIVFACDCVEGPGGGNGGGNSGGNGSA